MTPCFTEGPASWSRAERTDVQQVDVAAIQRRPQHLQAHARLDLRRRDQRRVPRQRVRREVGKPRGVLRARKRVRVG